MFWHQLGILIEDRDPAKMSVEFLQQRPLVAGARTDEVANNLGNRATRTFHSEGFELEGRAHRQKAIREDLFGSVSNDRFHDLKSIGRSCRVEIYFKKDSPRCLSPMRQVIRETFWALSLSVSKRESAVFLASFNTFLQRKESSRRFLCLTFRL